jgi:hypothetical protein
MTCCTTTGRFSQNMTLYGAGFGISQAAVNGQVMFGGAAAAVASWERYSNIRASSRWCRHWHNNDLFKGVPNDQLLYGAQPPGGKCSRVIIRA